MFETVPLNLRRLHYILLACAANSARDGSQLGPHPCPISSHATQTNRFLHTAHKSKCSSDDRRSDASVNVNCEEGHASRYFTNTLRSMSSELLSLLAGNFETIGQHEDTIYCSRRMLQYIATTLSKAPHQNTELACVCVAITSVTQQIAKIMQALAHAGTGPCRQPCRQTLTRKSHSC